MTRRHRQRQQQLIFDLRDQIKVARADDDIGLIVIQRSGIGLGFRAHDLQAHAHRQRLLVRFEASLALQPDRTLHFQIHEEPLARQLTGGGFLAHQTLQLPTELRVGVSRSIGRLLSKQARHVGQMDRATCRLACANEREKIECTKIHESNLLNALLLVREPDRPPCSARHLAPGRPVCDTARPNRETRDYSGQKPLASKGFAQNPLHLQALMTSASRPPLILASSSPYRRELLERLRLPFEIVVPNIDETPAPDESPDRTALRLARQKAEKVAAGHPGALVIGSDQVATLDGKQVGKPGDHARALAQLHWMRGRTVTFHSALCLYDGRTGQHQSEDIRTLATFRDLSDEELDAYLHLEHPYDVAGSAKSEGLGIALLERVESSDPTALVGLPLIALTSMLRNVHYPLFA